MIRINEELRALYQADQADRQPPIDWATMAAQDVIRRRRVEALIAAGALQVAEDYFHAAMVFQHGPTPDYHLRAHELAKRSVEMGGPPVAKWLTAAAYDRWLRGQGKPQKYGTQYSWQGDHWEVADVDPDTTDDERAAWEVPPLAVAQARAAQMDPPEPVIPLEDDPVIIVPNSPPLATWEAHGIKLEIHALPPGFTPPSRHDMGLTLPAALDEAPIPPGFPAGATVHRKDRIFLVVDANGEFVGSWGETTGPIILGHLSGQPLPVMTEVQIGERVGALVDQGDHGRLLIWSLSAETYGLVSGWLTVEQLLAIAENLVPSA